MLAYILVIQLLIREYTNAPYCKRFVVYIAFGLLSKYIFENQVTGQPGKLIQDKYRLNVDIMTNRKYKPSKY